MIDDEPKFNDWDKPLRPPLPARNETNYGEWPEVRVRASVSVPLTNILYVQAGELMFGDFPVQNPTPAAP